MELEINQKDAARKIYELYWDSYTKGDLDGFASTLDDQFEMIGTSETEVCHTKAEGLGFLKAQLNEVVGHVEMRNREMEVIPVDKLILINEQCDIYIRVDSDWNFYSKIRISTFLKETEAGWKVVQQHGSFPDMRVQAGETLAIEKISNENIELRDAVRRRTAELENKNRELAIEAALEKVRTLTMAMHNSEDVGKCIVRMFSELTALGVDESTRFGIGILNHDNENIQLWTARKDGEEVNMHIGNLQMSWHPLLKSARKAWKEQVRLHQYVLEGEDLVNYYKMINNAPDYKLQIVLEKLPEKEFHYGFVFDHGFFYAFCAREFQPDLIHITQRFSSLFEQTYRRYLDLVKAEGQAREAQIEAGLERVRSRSIAMQKSEELKEVISLLLAEIRKLDIPAEHAGFYIDYKQRDDWHIWLADPNQIPFELTVPYFDCLVWNNYNNAKEQGLDAFAYTISFEEKNDFYEKMFRLFAIPEEARNFYLNCPGLSVSTVLLDNVGLYVENFSGTPYTEEENRIVKRFGNVFQQTYTRFLDLQRAEEQTREAEIQLALERVRARAMAMHSSQELKEVVHVLRRQMGMLGQKNLETCVIHLHDESAEYIQSWAGISPPDSGGEILETIAQVPKKGLLIIEEALAAYEAKRQEYVVLNEGEKLAQWFSFLEKASPDGYQKLSDSVLGDIAELRSYWSFADFSGGSLLMVTRDEPDEATRGLLRRFSLVFGLAYRRFADLKQAEAQAREAKIEGALERVRSRSISMRKSGEIANIAAKIFTEMSQLDLNLNRALIWTFNDTEKYTTWWSSNPEVESTADSYRIDYNDTPVFLNYLQAWQKRTPIHLYTLSGEAKKNWEDHLFEHTDLAKLPIAVKNGMRGELTVYTVSIISDYGIMMSGSLNPLSDQSIDIIQRFGRVFQQSYTRYLDVQKAEAQARESQIQLALERIRARSMAMQHSDELAEVSYLLNKQVVELGIPTRGCAFNIYNEHDSTEWFSNLEGTLPTYKTPRENVFLKYYEAGRQGETLLVEEFGKERIRQHYEYLFSLGFFGSPEHKDEVMAKVIPDSQIDHVAFFKYGYLLFITLEPAPEAHDIFKRFAKEFEQTYTRFLDLQKAEAQAREAQIEAVLERVRGRSMAMHKSEELRSVVNTLYGELQSLHVHFHVVGIQLIPDNSMDLHLWLGTADGLYDDIIHWPYTDIPVFHEVYEARTTGKMLEFTMSEGTTREFFDEYFKLEAVPQKRKNALQNVRFIDMAGAYQKLTGIFVMRYTEGSYSSYEKDIVIRFSKVFEQTYTRFLDLQKAEVQALEAIKRASVDRVRAEIASMRTISDLDRIQPLIWNELKTLGVPFIRCGVFIMDEERKQVEAFLSTPDGKSMAAFRLPWFSTEQSTQIVTHWQRKQLFKDHMDEAAFSEYTNNLVQQGAVASDEKYVTENRPTDLYLHFLPFLQGMLYVGNNAPLKEDELRLVQNLADAFSTAYARYEDFNKLEAAKAAVDSAMGKLKATQSQLVQQEKLASLGQLTAGIAHEIKNPLNFVNNFSEISLELIDESLGEMNKTPERRDETLLCENLSHIRSNLRKVHEHGSRANAIVNSMLMHSRGGSGTPEPVMLNNFIREYSNLALHVMRAGKNPVSVQLVFDTDEKINEIPLIVEDFSRVVLNICNNAFDALRYTPDPILTIRTQLRNESVEIQFEDNGPGIPHEIRDKILQPFFTTKKGTEGTGLGLSIAYDIVKAHGGTLNVESEENVGTAFVINLPWM